MRIDKLFDVSLNRTVGASNVAKLARDKVTGLMITGFIGALQAQDFLNVKLRHASGTEVLVDRFPLPFLDAISNMRYGFSSSGANAVLGQVIVETAGTTDNTLAEAAIQYGAFYVDLGHLTLDQAELEIELNLFKTGVAGTELFSVYAIHNGDQPDKAYKYAQTKDLNTTEKGLRELYIAKTAGFINNATKAVTDINVLVDGDGGRTFSADVRGIMGATLIFSQIETNPADGILRVYTATDALPDNVNVKVTGNDVGTDTALVLIQEKIIPSMTSFSTINNAQEVLKKIERLEKAEPETAQAYRHANVISTSADLRLALMSVPGGI